MFDGNTKKFGKFLVAEHAWTSFNQGPILKLNLAVVPHDRVRVRFDLYTFVGNWRRLKGRPVRSRHISINVVDRD